MVSDLERKDILLQEAERKRIAEELHDTTVQDMVHLSQQLELVLYYIDDDIVQARLEVMSARKHIKNIISSVRDTIYDLRPIVFDNIGWKAAFEHLQNKLLEANLDLNVFFDIDDIDISDGIIGISIYRIVCEGCKNILKHSMAKKIEVSVKKEKKNIMIHIYDDGIGFEDRLQKNHFGLQFMHERVQSLSGDMEVISDSKGTKINILIPYF